MKVTFDAVTGWRIKGTEKTFARFEGALEAAKDGDHICAVISTSTEVSRCHYCKAIEEPTPGGWHCPHCGGC